MDQIGVPLAQSLASTEVHFCDGLDGKNAQR